MKPAAILFAIALIATGAPAMAQTGDGITPEISQCLHDNAAVVEMAEPDLTKATDYLVNQVCAAPIAAEQRRLNMQRTQELAERNRQQCLDRVAQQKGLDSALPQPPRRTYENCQAIYDNQIANGRNPLAIIIGVAQRPAAAVSMAAKLILELRTAHNKTRL